MEDGEDLLDYYISDDSESEYWARRMGRRVESSVMISPDRCLFPDTECESEVYWFRPDLSQGDPTYSSLTQLSSRLVTFFKAWRLRREGGCEERGLCERCLGCNRRLTAENVEKCLGGEEVITRLERNVKRLQSSISLRVQRELAAIFPTVLPPEVLQRISVEVLKDQQGTFLTFSPEHEERSKLGECYQALALVFTSAKSQFFINSEAARERLLSENENYYHNMHARLSPSIEKFHTAVDELENISNVF